MQCKHFGVCGSCKLYNLNYNEQLQQKVNLTQERFGDLKTPDLEIFSSKQIHFRDRAEFRVLHSDDNVSFAMHTLDKKELVKIQECLIVNEDVAKLLQILPPLIQKNDILKHRLYAIEFLSAKDDMLITLIYHKKIDETWLNEAMSLADKINTKIVGRSKGVKLATKSDFVTYRYEVNNKSYFLRVHEGSFSQPNSHINEKMIEYAVSLCEGLDGDLVELYCGAGNFTIPLSSYFDKVLATEISKSSIKAAKENIKLNGVENIKFIRLSASEFSEAVKKKRIFRRVVNEGVLLDSYDFSTILVDPPRAGLDSESIEVVSKIDNIIYISCSQESMIRDLKILLNDYEISDFAIFDQFPYTNHIETIIKLKRRGDGAFVC